MCVCDWGVATAPDRQLWPEGVVGLEKHPEKHIPDPLPQRQEHVEVTGPRLCLLSVWCGLATVQRKAPEAPRGTIGGIRGPDGLLRPQQQHHRPRAAHGSDEKPRCAHWGAPSSSPHRTHIAIFFGSPQAVKLWSQCTHDSALDQRAPLARSQGGQMDAEVQRPGQSQGFSSSFPTEDPDNDSASIDAVAFHHGGRVPGQSFAQASQIYTVVLRRKAFEGLPSCARVPGLSQHAGVLGAGTYTHTHTHDARASGAGPLHCLRTGESDTHAHMYTQVQRKKKPHPWSGSCSTRSRRVGEGRRMSSFGVPRIPPARGLPPVPRAAAGPARPPDQRAGAGSRW